ncbi:flavin monoamine oxidase family protein [Microbacterium sp. JZ31]|uniref:flavin monoamine oxidase family protein n=1 Tax=Microbacterium sp. JZ31 TaxID=1906274 RepID=UPI001933B144|nr:FAD-dependent oxidoreductase [Microbacterium sp. JZ31]
MGISRRTFLVGAGAGAVAVLLASCTGEPQQPPPTSEPPTTGPRPTGTASPGAPLAPAAIARSAWATDPYARGAVSFTPPGAGPDDRAVLARPVDDRVFFAGEATWERPGTLTAALRSGERAADDVRAASGDGERIAVVGAGLAGAVAARRLTRSGFEVTVIEARDRVGGRLQTLTADGWPVPPQLGGWWLTDDDTDLGIRLAALEIETETLEGETAMSGDAEVDVPSAAPVEAAIAWAEPQASDPSLAEALAESGADPDDPATAAFLALLAATSGADAQELSSWFPPALPAREPTAITSDAGALVESLLDGLQVARSTTVVGVVYDDSGVSLRLGTGEAMSFDRVVLTTPLGVLQDEGVEFEPPLPFSHRGAIAALGMGDIEMIWLRFDEDFWQTDAALWHVVDGAAPIRTWINLKPATGENILVGRIGGEAARQWAELPDEDAVAQALASLEPFRSPR